MENPLHWNRATNIINKALEESRKQELLGEMRMASLGHVISCRLREANCLSDHALEEVGLVGYSV